MHKNSRGAALLFVVAMLLLPYSIARTQQVTHPTLARPVAGLVMVPIGDASNAADTRYSDKGWGAVGYPYQLSKHEVTCAQYGEFLNAVARLDSHSLYHSNMLSRGITRTGRRGTYVYTVSPAWMNRPVAFVSFWNACRFANWLHNGKPTTGKQLSTTTENGAYDLSTVGKGTPRIARKADARWHLPNAHEWYKAAYYRGGGTQAGYWEYPTASMTAPAPSLATPDPGNTAIFANVVGQPNWVAPVGSRERSGSAYGVFDLGGNVAEWLDDVEDSKNEVGKTTLFRCLVGGSFNSPDAALFAAASWADRRNVIFYPTAQTFHCGFRVAARVPAERGKQE